MEKELRGRRIKCLNQQQEEKLYDDVQRKYTGGKPSTTAYTVKTAMIGGVAGAGAFVAPFGFEE